MQGSQQIKVVGGIVIGGVLFALPFARSGANKPTSTPQPTANHLAPPVESVPLYLPAESAPSPAIGLRDHDPPPAAPPVLVAAAPGGKSRLEDNGIPPAMPDMYQPLFDSAPPAVVRPQSTTAAAAPGGFDARQESRPTEGSRTHRIVDGDTLTRLAQRYWQDPSLADELFAANRDVLSAPDPLPLGVLLKIPARPATKPRISIAAPPAAIGAFEELPPPVRQPVAEMPLDEPLVPIRRPQP